MRRLIYALMILLLSDFLLQSSVHAADNIRIGFPDLAANFLSVPLGQKKGFFQEEGLQVEYIRMNIGLTSLVSGAIDYYANLGPGVTAAMRGIPVKVVACYVPRAPIALIARPEFKSVQELRGQTIGLQSFGGSLMATARLIFNHFGLDPDKEIKFLATGLIERRFAFMNQGLTAATLGGPPIDFLGKKMGFVVLARANELFDINGKCVDQPAEPKPFKDKVQHLSYPCEELSGLIFTYMGPTSQKPLLPRYDFLVRTDGIRVAYDAGYLHCNWLQRAENTVDPGHTSILHGPAFDPLYSRRLEHQAYEFVETEFGCRYIAARDGRTEGTKFVRSAGLYMPCIRIDSHLYMPLPESEPTIVHAIPSLDGAWRVPVDDYSLRDFGVTFYPFEEGVSEEELRKTIKGRGYGVEIDTQNENWIHDANINRAKSVRWQDTVALAGQGKIVDRTMEHLGSADRGVLLFRKIWFEQLRAIEEGRDPKGIIRDPAKNECIETKDFGNALVRSHGQSSEEVLCSIISNGG